MMWCDAVWSCRVWSHWCTPWSVRMIADWSELSPSSWSWTLREEIIEEDKKRKSIFFFCSSSPPPTTQRTPDSPFHSISFGLSSNASSSSLCHTVNFTLICIKRDEVGKKDEIPVFFLLFGWLDGEEMKPCSFFYIYTFSELFFLRSSIAGFIRFGMMEVRQEN